MSTTNSNLIKITINSIEQLKTIIKNKTYNSFKLESPIVIMGIQTKTKTRKPGIKPPRISNRQILEQILKRLDKNDKHWERQEEFNRQQLEFNKQISTLLNNVIKLNNLKTK